MRLPEPFHFFVDRGLGRGDVPAALRLALLAGEQLHLHDDYLAKNAPDAEWLRLVGERKWVALCKDVDIRRNPLERQALVNAGAAVFILRHGGLSGPLQGAALASALPRVRRVLRRAHVAIIASVSSEGGVLVLWERGQRLERARPVK